MRTKREIVQLLKNLRWDLGERESMNKSLFERNTSVNKYGNVVYNTRNSYVEAIKEAIAYLSIDFDQSEDVTVTCPCCNRVLDMGCCHECGEVYNPCP